MWRTSGAPAARRSSVVITVYFNHCITRRVRTAKNDAHSSHRNLFRENTRDTRNVWKMENLCERAWSSAYMSVIRKVCYSEMTLQYSRVYCGNAVLSVWLYAVSWSLENVRVPLARTSKQRRTVITYVVLCYVKSGHLFLSSYCACIRNWGTHHASVIWFCACWVDMFQWYSFDLMHKVLVWILFSKLKILSVVCSFVWLVSLLFFVFCWLFSSADDVSSAELMVLLIVRRPSSVGQLLL